MAIFIVFSVDAYLWGNRCFCELSDLRLSKRPKKSNAPDSCEPRGCVAVMGTVALQHYLRGLCGLWALLGFYHAVFD